MSAPEDHAGARLMRLADKVCVITGAGSGIGEASALLFAREGARVAVVDVDEPAARRTVERIRADGGQADARRVDVSSLSDTEACAGWAIERWGRIDVLFNNAGISGVGDVFETDPELFDRVMSVNVRGVYLMTRAVAGHMIERGGGSIINMSSCIAQIGLARRVSYSASKGAVLSMTKSMQVDLAPHGIRVNALMPGHDLHAVRGEIPHVVVRGSRAGAGGHSQSSAWRRVGHARGRGARGALPCLGRVEVHDGRRLHHRRRRDRRALGAWQAVSTWITGFSAALDMLDMLEADIVAALIG